MYIIITSLSSKSGEVADRSVGNAQNDVVIFCNCLCGIVQTTCNDVYMTSIAMVASG